MHPHFTAELARMRTEEMIARADRYRLAQQARSRKAREPYGLSRRARAYRMALAAVALSATHYQGGK